MSDMLSSCWVAFARDGAPSCPGAPDWPPYTPEGDLQIELGETVSVGPVERAFAFDLMVEQFLETAAPGGRSVR